MRKAKIDYLVKSLDTSNNFTTVGEVKNNRIKFVDTENTTNYIVFHKDIIEYYKKGNIDMKFLFKTNILTKGLYTVLTSKFDFDILTDVIEVSRNSVIVEYRLVQDDEVINETVLNVDYYFLEEE